MTTTLEGGKVGSTPTARTIEQPLALHGVTHYACSADLYVLWYTEHENLRWFYAGDIPEGVDLGVGKLCSLSNDRESAD